METAGANGTANGKKIGDYFAAWVDEAGDGRRGWSR
jgi:hypothetical protein